MKVKSILKFVMILVIVCNLAAFSKENFSGQWTLDRTKTDVSGSQLFLAKISVEQKGDSLSCIRTYEAEYGEQYPFTEKLTLDKKEYSITIYDMPRTASAGWSEDFKNILIKTKTTFEGDSGSTDLFIAETWSLKENGKVLFMEISSGMGDQAWKSTSHFNGEKIDK